MVSIRDKAVVRRADEEDLRAMAEINAATFGGNKGSMDRALQWVTCRFHAFPQYQYFVLEVEGEVIGYVGWEILGGFMRSEPVIELEQVALSAEFQGGGLGSRLNEETQGMMMEWIADDNPNATEVRVVVWAYALNAPAMASYRRQFHDQMQGMRNMYGDGDRTENMLRLRILVEPYRK